MLSLWYTWSHLMLLQQFQQLLPRLLARDAVQGHVCCCCVLADLAQCWNDDTARRCVLRGECIRPAGQQITASISCSCLVSACAPQLLAAACPVTRSSCCLREMGDCHQMVLSKHTVGHTGQCLQQAQAASHMFYAVLHVLLCSPDPI
jgi:hypothetical protein